MSDRARKLLQRAGWYEGRRVLGKVKLPNLFAFHQAGLDILDEFGNLHLHANNRDLMHFFPIACDGEEGRYNDLSLELNQWLCPLGEVDYGRFFLGADEAGRIYLVGMDAELLGNNIGEALDHLLRLG